MNTRHNWTKQDDYYVYSLYKLRISDISKLKKVAQDIGCKLSSLKMRIKNFEYIDTKTSGLSNYGKISKEVYLELRNNPQKEQNIICEFKNKFRFWLL